MKNCNCSFFKSLDSFGAPIQLTFNKEKYYKTYIGAFISVIIKGIALYFFISQLIEWMNIVNSTIILSNENYNIPDLLNNNKSYTYDLDNKNYNIYFVVRAALPNKILSYQELSTYFKIQYFFVFDYYYIPIESEPCNVRKSYDFLIKNYDKEKIPEDQVNNYRICIKDPLKMGLMVDLEQNSVKRPILSFQVSPCQNTSESSRCASEDEIMEMISLTDKSVFQRHFMILKIKLTL